MTRTRLLSAAALAAGSALLLAGCAGGGGGGGTAAEGWNEPTADLSGVTITYGSAEGGGPIEEVAEAFEEATGATVEKVVFPDPYEQSLLTKVAVGDAPDLAAWQPTASALVQLQPGKNLIPLDDAPWLDRLDPDLRDLTGFYDDTRYAALVQSPAAIGAYYNKDVFAAAGVEGEPSGWDELLEAADKIKATGIRPFFDAGGAQWTTQWAVQVQLAEASRDGLWQDVNAREATFADGPILEAITEYDRLIQEGYFNEDIGTATFEDSGAKLLAGETGVVFQVGALGNVLQSLADTDELNEKIGWFPISETGNVSTFIPDSSNAVVAFRSGDAEREAAAKQFLNFWQTEYYEDYVSNPDAPKVSIQTDVPTPDSIPEIVLAISESLGDTAGSMQAEAVANPDLYLNLANMVQGTVTPQEAAEATQNQFEELAKAQGVEGF